MRNPPDTATMRPGLLKPPSWFSKRQLGPRTTSITDEPIRTMAWTEQAEARSWDPLTEGLYR